MPFTNRQLQVLKLWDNGSLLRDLNKKISAFGHGRLQNSEGDTMDIGGSTGGGSRRVIDEWAQPDWRELVEATRATQNT